MLPLVALVWAFAPPVASAPPFVPGRFRDEMNTPLLWTFANGTEPVIAPDTPGFLSLTLPQAAVGYSFSYQWGTVTRMVVIDTTATPLLVARVARISDGGYAHTEVEMRDYSGAVIKVVRSNSLQSAGFATVNLQKEFGTGLLRLYVRLVVGGANSGAWVQYDYLRATTVAEFATAQNAPRATAPKPRRKKQPRASVATPVAKGRVERFQTPKSVL